MHGRQYGSLQFNVAQYFTLFNFFSSPQAEHLTLIFSLLYLDKNLIPNFKKLRTFLRCFLGKFAKLLFQIVFSLIS